MYSVKTQIYTISPCHTLYTLHFTLTSTSQLNTVNTKYIQLPSIVLKKPFYHFVTEPLQQLSTLSSIVYIPDLSVTKGHVYVTVTSLDDYSLEFES